MDDDAIDDLLERSDLQRKADKENGVSNVPVTALHDDATLSYTTDDDGIWLACICGERTLLGHEATLSSAQQAQQQHVLAVIATLEQAPTQPLWGVSLTFPGTTRRFVLHVNAATEEAARAEARKLEPYAEVGMAELTETPGTEPGN